MKAQIHPQWYPDAVVTCACGNTFTTGATYPSMKVDICAACHPFYTGQMKFVDTAGRVDAFRAKMEAAQGKVLSKADKRKQKRELKLAKDMDAPQSLSELRKPEKKSKN